MIKTLKRNLLKSIRCRRQLNHYRKLKKAFNKLPVHLIDGWYLCMDFFVLVDSKVDESKELCVLKNVEDGKIMYKYCFDIDSKSKFDIKTEIDKIYDVIYDQFANKK